ncbi:MAG: alpha/beta hydrolase [Pseudomonadota bacterium]|nr:alpha/beta hydrolase [Pseudomonadota bacterium]
MQKNSGQIYFETFPGNGKIRVGHWRPETPANGTVVLLHGRTEFIEKYTETIIELIQRRYEVWSMDWRGQGLSQKTFTKPRKGHIDKFETYLLDLEFFLNRVIKPQGIPPLLLAHSMGGHIAARALLEGHTKFRGLIITSPMFDLPFNCAKKSCVKLAVRLGNMVGMGEKFVTGTGEYNSKRIHFDGNALTGDRARFDAVHQTISKQPNLALGGPTFGWLDAAFRSIKLLKSIPPPPTYPCPVLVCTATRDTVVSVGMQAELCAKHKWQQVHFPNARHELLQETDPIRNHFWKTFDQFTACI